MNNAFNKVYLGYWRNNNQPETFHLPLPIAESATADEVAQSVLILRHQVKPKSQLTHYKGISMCRCCGCFNHSGEYQYRHKVKGEPMVIYIIPEGLEHYIVKHKVLVPELLKIKFT